jgi:hypothetical protein
MTGLTQSQRAAIESAEAEIARIIARLGAENDLIVDTIEANADSIEIVAFNVREIGE